MAKDYYTDSFASLKEFWERKGKTKSFEREYSIRLEGIKKLVGEIRTYARGKNVLDIGCGPGIAASLLPTDSKIIGLDFSISMLRSAKNRIDNLVQGSAFHLPFCDCSFDAVSCLFVASDYSDKTGIFDEAHRVLREKGFFLFADYSLDDEHWKFKRTIRPLMGEECNIFIDNESLLSNYMRNSGFWVKEIRCVQFRTSFKLERYVMSKVEMNRLKTSNPDLWNDVQRCMKNMKINREFVLIIGTKQSNDRSQRVIKV